VLDEGNMRKFLRKNPARGLQILRAITKREAPNSSLYGPER
jgi:hypothetical protein